MKKSLPLLIVSLLFIGGLTLLFQKQKDRLLSNNETRICLNRDLSKSSLTDALLRNSYAETKEDANLISEWLIDSLFIKQEKSMPKLASLNARSFQIPDSIIEKRGGTGLKHRLYLSYKDLGCDSISLLDYETYPNNLEETDSTCTISVLVRDDKRHFFNEGGVEGVYVRLKQHKIVRDSLSLKPVEADAVVAYAKTNSEGIVTFNVKKDCYYSVLPIRKGYEYGMPKGTTHGKTIEEERMSHSSVLPWKNSPTFSFTEREHRVRVFDRATYSRIKADDTFSIRSLSDYITELVKISVLFLFAWWSTFLFIRWKDRKLVRMDSRRYKESDSSIISILMLLNAICLFMMLAIVNPLVDTDYANEMIWGTLIGCFGLCMLSSVDYVRYYSNQYKIYYRIPKCFQKKSSLDGSNPLQTSAQSINIKFDIISKYLKHKISERIPEGIGFLLVAFLFVILLGLFGTGPEGSTAKVNLNVGFPFQPSEISKFFFVTAIALFFTANASKIQAFANGFYLKSQFKTLIWIVVSVMVLLALYIGLISDMGPALVLAVTFIIMYSIVRQDLKQLFFGVLSYIFVLSLANYLIHIDKINYVANNNLAIVLYLSLIWYTLWFAIGYLWKKKIYESAGFMNLLILLFTHGGELLNMFGFSNQGQRLMDRIAASGDGIWDNTVRGGDQVAQGIWALASGGLTGQGLGNGNANLIPAFHTDMIFESIGEVLGFGALLTILVCYSYLTRKCLIKSKESGHPFLFYLITGITIVTIVQLFVIVMGSLGIVPLTGVSLPFLSYGKASLIINLAAFGIIISMSRNNPTIHQQTSIIGYNNVIKSGLIVFSLLFAVVVAYAFNYQVISRDTYLTKPAYITNLSGEHFPEQNPRISMLLRNIHSGNIYDRNGLLLATSNPDTLLLYKEQLAAVGINRVTIDSLSNKIQKRYYPFGEHLFFMLGDMNTRNLSSGVFSKSPYGYLAEERHIDNLRGLSIPTQSASITRVLKISPYLPDSVYKDDWNVPQYGENKDLINMLKDGVNGDLVRRWNEKRSDRDLTLTLDASLQMSLQKAFEKNASKLSNNYSRVSLVILKPESGDLLCSANYPVPDQDQIVSLFDRRVYYYRPDTLYGRYTERDLGLTFQSAPGSTAKVFSSAAGLEKSGEDGTKAIYIYPQERIHTTQGAEPSGEVNMKQAIVKSSNCFFVNTVHKYRLYDNLKPLYLQTGIGVGSHVPYIFNESELSDLEKNEYFKEIDKVASAAYNTYDDYISKRGKNGFGYKKMNFPICGMSWGQGIMVASPLNMARMVSIISNNGIYYKTRYLMEEEADSVKCMQENYSKLLKSYMREETAGHPATQKYERSNGMGGKTGTPTRTISSPQKIFTAVNKKGRRVNTNITNKNDGWYICFLNSNNGQLAMALRIEQCGSSSVATRWINEVVMPTLKEVGYIN